MVEKAKFLHGPLMGHVAVMSFTASLGLMAVFLVDFADMLFISMLGNAALAAAIGYAGAILFFTTSISIAFAIATAALSARAIGQGDNDRARHVASHAITFGIGIAIVIASVVWLNLHSLVALIGAQGEVADLAVGYLRIIVPSLPVIVIAMSAGAFLRAHGAARAAMWSTIGGAVVNAVLDPILIFGFDMELQGAAIASVISRMAMAWFALRPIWRDYGGLPLPRISELVADIRPVAALAIPAMMTNVATPVGQAWVTRSMAQFGEDAVAGMAIISRIAPVAFAVIFALSGAIGPIIGQNAGANQPERVRRAFTDGLLFVVGYIVVAATLLYLLRAPIAGVFEAQGITRSLIYLFCGPIALLWGFNGAIFVGNAVFNNLGHPLWSACVNWGRNTLGTIPFVALGAMWYGASGVLIGQAVGGVVFGILSIWLGYRLTSHQLPPLGDRTLPPMQIRLMQLMGRNR
ncbi:putative efflux protein, MATE family [Monaibacterium marinum]|uniref:Putative efflux protein, MATE family n=1 Tax=Pontivivens marinum TaxID=1690039 RepID=A0A2C9CTY7_9RHOB|nr:MATE family efflux transporter [Monaibacterium marinum]SOH94732.1 putative efflux protein, MATE family [Monaibacterium marinum]